MGRHSEESDASVDTDTDALDSKKTPTRSAEADAFWEKVGVEPVEIALPKGVGLTLRAYRMSDTVEPTVVDRDEEDADPEPIDVRDEEDDSDERGEDDDDLDFSDDLDDDDDEDEDDEEPEPEEIPVFLSHRGTLPLFETAAALVAHIRSDAPHDLRSIDTWDELVEGIKPEYVVAAEDDSYELDLVVRNLRGGHDTWDPELLISAGELARDLGYALRLPTVITTLSPDSPLDELDNALRGMVDGGLRAMFARRRVRRIGAQQTALAWRGIINKIGESVDWRN